jgi:broad specificity phosphatase PhoE
MKKYFVSTAIACVTAFSALAVPKEILFVRHGESEYNMLSRAGKRDEGMKIRDPHLSPVGIEQAVELGKRLESYPIDKVLVSPMYRTLQTASALFGDRGVPLVIVADIIEHCPGLHAGCMASERSLLENNFPAFNFGTLPEEWHSDYSDVQVETRVENFKKALFEMTGPQNIAVVSHAEFLKNLLGVRLGNCETVRARFDSQGQLEIIAETSDL